MALVSFVVNIGSGLTADFSKSGQRYSHLTNQNLRCKTVQPGSSTGKTAQIVQFRVHADRWIKREKAHFYRVSPNLTKMCTNINKKVVNPKLKE